MNNEFAAFVSDEATRAAIAGWADRQGLASDSVQMASIETCISVVENETTPRLIMVDIDGHEAPAPALGRLVSLIGTITKVIAIGSANDVALYRQLMAVGVSDYLPKPLTNEQLTAIMAQSLRGDAPSGPTTHDAKTIVMIGARGGVGVSTTAINTASILANEFNRKALLLDLDLQFGTNALALDLEPARGLRDILSSPQRVDGLMITGSLTSASANLNLLAAEEGIDDHVTVDGAAITALMKELRPQYDFIIVDLPRHLLPSQKRLLAAAHEIVIATELSLIGIRDSLRLHTALKSLGCPARVTVIATGIGPQRPSQIDEATFTKGSQMKVNFTIPDDIKSVTTAANGGKTVTEVAPDAALSKMLRALAMHLAHIETEASESKKSSLLGGLFGGKKEEAAPKKDDKKKGH